MARVTINSRRMGEKGAREAMTNDKRAAVEFVADTDSLSDGLFYLREQDKINQQTQSVGLDVTVHENLNRKIARQMPNFRGENEQKFGNLLTERQIKRAF